MELRDKVIFITGATGGIAIEIIRLLSKKNSKIAMFAREENKLKEIQEIFRMSDLNCIYKKCDVKNKNNIKNAVDLTIESFGRIDIAILSAGILIPNPIQTFNSDVIKNSMNINFMGVVYSIEQLFPIMKKQNYGTIAAISTLPDRRGIPGWGAYGSSKAAISWLMESLRVEAKQLYNINMITIKPGSVNTKMINKYHRPEAISAEKAAKVIIKGIRNEKRVIQFPLSQVMMIHIKNLFPSIAYDLIPIELSKGEGYPKVEEK